MIVDNEDGGLNIKFSRADLVAMPPSDFQLLQLFVEALTEEYGKEEINDLPHGTTRRTSMTEEESNLVQHARRELALLGNGPEMNDHILEMIKIFSGAGHSGYSGFYAIGVITKLLNFENLTDLTDDPDEWHHHEYDQSGYTNGIWRAEGNVMAHIETYSPIRGDQGPQRVDDATSEIV